MEETTTAIRASQWSEMSFKDLCEQRNKLFTIYDYLTSQSKDTTMIIQGLQKIDKIIAEAN